MKKEIKTSGAVSKYSPSKKVNTVVKPTKTPEQLEAIRVKAEAKALRKEAFHENKETGRDYTRVRKITHHQASLTTEDSE
jgi:hypothetical protein